VSFEISLRSALINDAGVSALIGDRLYHAQLVESPVYPAGTLQRAGTNPFYVQTRGRGNLVGGQATMGWVRISLAFWTTGAAAAETGESIAQAIMAAMENFNNSAQPTSPAVIFSAPNYLVTRRSGVEPGTQPPLFKELLDFRMLFQD
jgi:hypothetical protein